MSNLPLHDRLPDSRDVGPVSGPHRVGGPGAPWSGPFSRGELLEGKYEVIGVLGSGGMGVVYEAHDQLLDRAVAVKVPLREGLTASLVREAQAMAQVNHPSLVTIHAMGSHRDIAYLVMERVYGMTLEDRVIEASRAGRPVPLLEALDVLIAVADALAALHRAGVAHRDIKTANVMITGSTTRVVLTDLGLVTPEVAVSAGGPIAGSIDYMAPELILGAVQPGMGPSVDVYALGVMAFELLSGARPYAAANHQAVLMAQIQRPVPDVREVRREVPDDLAHLLREMMAKAATDRPESADLVRWRFEAIREVVAAAPSVDLLTVLVIDDDPEVGAALARDLTWSLPRLAVEAETDAEAAVLRIRRSPPSMVLIDLDMAGMNGVELCMALSALPEGGNVAIVAMGADASEADLAVLRSLGMSEFVAKDSCLAARVADVIANLRRASAPAASSRRSTRPGSNRPCAATLRSRPR